MSARRRVRSDRVELPPDSTIKAWKEEGLTYQQMVERWFNETGQLATKAAFNMRCSRNGWTKAPVEQPVIPWVVETRHQNEYHLQMLRFEGMRRRGEKLQPRKEAKLDYFLAQRAGKTVVHYEPNSAEGFWDVQKEWFDYDIFRDPRLHSLSGTNAPSASRRDSVKARAREKFDRGF